MTARLQPAIDRITEHPWVLRHVPALADPDLWHLNRRSTARAVAVGLFCGLIPGPLQVISAIAGSLVVRANFPVAVVTTFYTNPFTIVPLYLVAYEYGSLFLPSGVARASALDPPPLAAPGIWLPQLAEWMAAMGKPLALGLVLLALTLAVVGWVVVRLGWRAHAVWAWRRRARLRARRDA
jgi:hypothetical protein